MAIRLECINCKQEFYRYPSEILYGNCKCCSLECRREYEKRPERIWNLVDKNGPTPEHVPDIGNCWIWKGNINCKNGYGQISFGGVNSKAHRITFMLEYGRYPFPLGLHKCDNRACVRPDHIFEGDHQDNCDDRMNKNRHRSNPLLGSNHQNSILKNEDIPIIREMLKKGVFQKEIANIYNVDDETISNINRGITWTHIPGYEKSLEKRGPRGESNRHSKLSNEDVLEIRKRLTLGHKKIDIAKDYNVSKSSIKRIANGKSWSHL